MSVHQASTAAGALPRIYAEDLAPSLQALLAALADIDFSYDLDFDQLRQAPLPETTASSDRPGVEAAASA